MEHSVNIPVFNIPGTLFGNINSNFIGIFSQIFRKYIMGMFHKYSTNIYLLSGLVTLINWKLSSKMELLFGSSSKVMSKKEIIQYKEGHLKSFPAI